VANKLGHEPSNATEVFGDRFTFVPSMGGDVLTFIEVDMGRGVFQRFNGPFKAEGLNLVVLDLWDWWKSGGYWDLPFYEVRIDAFPEKPELMGRTGLVEVLQGKVLWSEPS